MRYADYSEKDESREKLEERDLLMRRIRDWKRMTSLVDDSRKTRIIKDFAWLIFRS